jgi:hypothetical protein
VHQAILRGKNMLKTIENSLKALEKPVKLCIVAAIVGGIIFALAVVSNIGAGSADPNPPPLFKVNVTNTPNVSVVNTPTVNIGAGSVGITGMPNVTVANTITNPVPVRDTDNPAIQPFQTEIALDLTSFTSKVGTFTVPAGKRLVIEFVSIFAQVNQGQKELVNIETTAGNTVASYTVVPNFYGTEVSSNPAFDVFVGNQQMRVYADPGSTVNILVYGQLNTNALGGQTVVSLSGYLVNSS